MPNSKHQTSRELSLWDLRLPLQTREPQVVGSLSIFQEHRLQVVLCLVIQNQSDLMSSDDQQRNQPFSGHILQRDKKQWIKKTHTQTQIRHWEIAEGVSPSISFERSIVLCWKYCPARGLCVFVSCFNKQAVTGQLLIREMQGDRALWCYSVQRSYAPEREASTGHGMYLQTCSNSVFLCQWILRSFFHNAVGFDYTLRKFLSFMATGLSHKPSMRNHAN